jgi:hypothetical protein
MPCHNIPGGSKSESEWVRGSKITRPNECKRQFALPRYQSRPALAKILLLQEIKIYCRTQRSFYASVRLIERVATDVCLGLLSFQEACRG